VGLPMVGGVVSLVTPYWPYTPLTELAWLLCLCRPYISVSALLELGLRLRPYCPVSGGGVGVPEF
jgi:hypothetical protein